MFLTICFKRLVDIFLDFPDILIMFFQHVAFGSLKVFHTVDLKPEISMTASYAGHQLIRFRPHPSTCHFYIQALTYSANKGPKEAAQ